MSNSQSKLKRKFNKLKVVKRTIQFLPVSPDLDVVKAVIIKALYAVISAIFNEALKLSPGRRKHPTAPDTFVKRHNHHFYYLFDRRKLILFKRQLILQNGGAPLIIASLLA